MSTDDDNDFAGMDSPQTAWKRRNEEMMISGRKRMMGGGGGRESSVEEEKTSDDDRESESDDGGGGTTSNTSVLSVVVARDRGNRAKTTASSASVSSGSKGAEHVDGFFRNLNAVQDNAKTSFQDANVKVARKNAVTAGANSNDSLSSDEEEEEEDDSSLSADSVASDGVRKGPRPAYSEANMQNSLGYLP